MRAKTELRLVHTRHRDADQVEVVEIASGESILLWDVLPRDAKRFVRALRADLDGLQAEEFLARWGAIASPADLPR
jgi:hypothetical protein